MVCRCFTARFATKCSTILSLTAYSEEKWSRYLQNADGHRTIRKNSAYVHHDTFIQSVLFLAACRRIFGPKVIA